MSIRVMAEVWDHGPNSQTELLVLLALADFSNDAGECWPSMARIAEKARIQERSAIRIIRRLEAAGYVKTVIGGGRHGCNQYTINPDPPVTLTDSHPDPDDTETLTLSAKNPDPPVTRTIIEPSLEPSHIHQTFEMFWDVCPRKVGKGAARKAYEKAVKKTRAGILFSAMSRYALEREGKDSRYTVHPATWLNQERWLDEPDAPDFHAQFDAALKGASDGLQLTHSRDSGEAEHLSPNALPESGNRRGGKDGADKGDGGRHQRPHLSLIRPNRFGGQGG